MSKHGRLSIQLATIVLMGAISCGAVAESGHWFCFDAAFPEDLIDTRNVLPAGKSVVRFWERGGACPKGDRPDSKFGRFHASRPRQCALLPADDLPIQVP